MDDDIELEIENQLMETDDIAEDYFNDSKDSQEEETLSLDDDLSDDGSEEDSFNPND